MFEWYWFFLYYIIFFHIMLITNSLYLHRTLGHKMFKVSKPLEYFFRFMLWLPMVLPKGRLWVELYVARHRKHHAYTDTVNDPHSPHHLSFKELCQVKCITQEDIAKYAPDVRTPDDWMQRIMHEKYRYLGPWVLQLIPLILFGIMGLVLSLMMRKLASGRRLDTFVSDYANHKLGFRYAGNRFKHDRSTIIFPIGILLSGEELHANHHNCPGSPSFRQRWFELDMGYVYAVILSKVGLLEIVEKNNARNYL
jgi:stearoyl-CoA desaturase (delta-9 desaturase)